LEQTVSSKQDHHLIVGISQILRIKPEKTMSMLISIKRLLAKEYPTNQPRTNGEIDLQYHRHSIQYPESLFETPATIVSEKWGGCHPIFYNYDPLFLNDLSTQFRVFQGCPDIKIFENVIYIPQYHCLYSSEGMRINESCLYTNPNGTKLSTKAPEKIKPPKTIKKVCQKFIYAGRIGRHYGHFLTNNTSRLWYTAKNQELPILCHGIVKKSFIDFFFKSLQFDINRFFSFDSPVLLTEVIVPNPSFSNKFEGFEVHKLLPENVAKAVLKTKLQQTSQPLYFSRRQLNKNRRAVANEDKLEKELNHKNFAICYPETLSLEEQIHLINKHEVIVGMIGSALHNILFDISQNRNIVCFGNKNGFNFNTNCLMIDAIKSVKSVYIAALEREEKIVNIGKENRILDLDIAIEGLRNVGLL
jgi:Glycosyltransferase 61